MNDLPILSLLKTAKTMLETKDLRPWNSPSGFIEAWMMAGLKLVLAPEMYDTTFSIWQQCIICCCR